MRLLRHAFKPSTLSLSIAFALLAPQVHAATFEGAITGDGSLLASQGPDTASVYGYTPTAGYQASTFEAYVSSGWSRVSAISDGTAAATVASTLTYRQQVTNPYGSAQAVAFDFFIPRSRTVIDLGYGANFQSFDASATFVGTITWGGQTVWSMQYGVQGSGSVAGGGGSITQSGPLLSASAGGFSVGQLYGNPVSVSTQSVGTCGYDDADVWNCSYHDVEGLVGSGAVSSDPYNGRLNLGVLAGHETRELTYTLSAQAHFEGTYRDDAAASMYGYGGYAQAGGYDPFGIEFTPDAEGTGIALQFSAPVPEPGTYALMLGGLALVGWLARRPRRRA